MNGDLGAAVRVMIAERAARREAAYRDRERWVAEFRAGKDARRDTGLQRRHAAKLGLIPRQRPVPD